MNDVMLDLETLDIQYHSAILSIGAVLFNVEEPFRAIRTFDMCVRMGDAVKFGSVSGDTIAFWMQQSEETQRPHLIAAKSGHSLEEVLLRFTGWLPKQPYLWGNSSTFDNIILRHAYEATGLELPWNTFHDRCYRTMKSLPGAPPMKRMEGTTHHKALDDAINQANHLCEIYAKLGLQGDY